MKLYEIMICILLIFVLSLIIPVAICLGMNIISGYTLFSSVGEAFDLIISQLAWILFIPSMLSLSFLIYQITDYVMKDE